jgi:alanyl-tRNA synthetase
LRFDFTHSTAVTAAQLREIEALTNNEILANHVAHTKLMTPDAAINEGAIALFGEKYGEIVRVLRFGDFSVELCGGTHVERTGDIGLVKIINESSVASGVRRIEAITGSSIIERIYSLQDSNNLEQAILRKTIQDLQKQLTESKRQVAVGSGENQEVTTIAGINAIFKHLKDIQAKDLKGIVDDLKKSLTSGIVVVTSTYDEKVSLVIAVTNDLTSKISAVDLVKVAAITVGGQGGGGRPDMAQAGGTDPKSINKIHEALENRLRE